MTTTVTNSSTQNFSCPPNQTIGSTKPVSPVEYVQGLSPEDKEDILILLVREMIQINGDKGLIPITSFEGEGLGYYVPPAAAKARWKKFLEGMPTQVREEMTRPIAEVDLNDTIDAHELIAELRKEEALQSQ